MPGTEAAIAFRAQLIRTALDQLPSGLSQGDHGRCRCLGRIPRGRSCRGPCRRLDCRSAAPPSCSSLDQFLQALRILVARVSSIYLSSELAVPSPEYEYQSCPSPPPLEGSRSGLQWRDNFLDHIAGCRAANLSRFWSVANTSRDNRLAPPLANLRCETN